MASEALSWCDDEERGGIATWFMTGSGERRGGSAKYLSSFIL
jgi:hypothetical protein